MELGFCEWKGGFWDRFWVGARRGRVEVIAGCFGEVWGWFWKGFGGLKGSGFQRKGEEEDTEFCTGGGREFRDSHALSGSIWIGKRVWKESR